MSGAERSSGGNVAKGQGRSNSRSDLRPDAPAASLAARPVQREAAAKSRASGKAPPRPQVPTAPTLVRPNQSNGAATASSPSSSKADFLLDVPAPAPAAATPAPCRQSHSDAREVEAEIVRLQAENDRLKGALEQGSGGPWITALLAELERESLEQQRVLCLKRELCGAIQRRRKLEEAVQAGHASLERALYGALAQNGTSLHTLEQAFVDGTAAAEAELAEEAMLLEAEAAPKPPGRRASPSPARTPSEGGQTITPKATSSRRRCWLAVEELDLNDHGPETIVLIYI